jgi:hypothetical protein
MLQHESNPMDVADDDVRQDELIPSERAVLVEDGIRWKQHLAAGQHLNDWLAFGPGLMIRRKLAMRLAFVNKPEGRGYAAEFGKLMKQDGLDTMEKSAVSALLWLQNAEHLAILKEIRDGMTDSERARLNSPISARQRVEKLLKARANGNEDKLIVPSPVTTYRERIAEQEREIAALRERLLRSQDNGSLFDLKKDTIENIADTIVEQLPPSRSKGIADAIRKKLKAKVKPAG